MSQSIIPELDVFTSPSGSVVVDYYPGNGEGPTGNNSTVNIASVNNSQASGLEVVGAIIKSLDISSIGYVAQLFVTDTSSDYVAGQTLNNNYWSVIPEFANPNLLGGNKVTHLDVEQASKAAQTKGFSTQAEVLTWLNSNEVKTGQLILERASFNK